MGNDSRKILGKEFAGFQFVRELVQAPGGIAFEEKIYPDFVPGADAGSDAYCFGGPGTFTGIGCGPDEQGANHQLKLWNSSVEAMMSLNTVKPESVAIPGGTRPRRWRL